MQLKHGNNASRQAILTRDMGLRKLGRSALAIAIASVVAFAQEVSSAGSSVYCMLKAACLDVRSERQKWKRKKASVELGDPSICAKK